MPRRVCICTGCPGCTGKPAHTYDRDSSPGSQRCASCQQHATRKRNARSSTTARGYGAAHQRQRDQLATTFQPGQPCARCRKPINSIGDADLGHADDRSTYRGLEHSACNRSAAGKKKRTTKRRNA